MWVRNTRERVSRRGLAESLLKLLPKGTVLLAMIDEGKTRGQSAVLGVTGTINRMLKNQPIASDAKRAPENRNLLRRTYPHPLRGIPTANDSGGRSTGRGVCGCHEFSRTCRNWAFGLCRRRSKIIAIGWFFRLRYTISLDFPKP